MYSDLASYYHRWYHQRPVALTSARWQELERLHRVLYTCVRFFCDSYGEFLPGVMPLSDKEMTLLEHQRQYPFRAGTWRPDYILDTDGNIRLCEITSRFFAHGIFMSWFGEQAADRFLREHFPGETRRTCFPEMMEYMRGLADGKKTLFVLKSADKSGEIRLYSRFYSSLGLQVEVAEAPEVEARRKDWCRPDALVVNALNQRDLLGFSMDTLDALMEAGLYSNLCNTFLIHDKRLMALWFRDSFTSRCLDPEDTDFLRAHAIPTFLEIPADAYENKDRYILKPWRLGKSEGLLPGPLMTEDQWKRRLDGGTEGLLAQPFIGQRTFHTVWEGTPFEDYLCGMMLCVDQHFFGPGYFRFSSLPVTNWGDDRKGCALQTDNPDILPDCDVL